MRLIIGLMILMFSCKQQGETTSQSESITLSDHQDKIEERYDTLFSKEFASIFKYSELEIYNVKDNSELRGLYREFNFWGKKRILINNTLKILELRGQPISYRSLNEKIIRITTINEEDSQLMILAWTLDEDFQIIDNVTLTSMGGDEGAGVFSFGKFLNDTLFSITLQQTKYDSEEIETENTRCLIFHGNGIIERVENCR